MASPSRSGAGSLCLVCATSGRTGPSPACTAVLIVPVSPSRQPASSSCFPFLHSLLLWHPCYLVSRLWLTELCIVTLFHILPVLVMMFLPVCVSYASCKAANAGHSVSTEAGDTEETAAIYRYQAITFCTPQMECCANLTMQMKSRILEQQSQISTGFSKYVSTCQHV